jgi:hypothetical protein
VSWDTSVDTSTPLTVDLESGNDFYMNYYADQFEDGWPGGYCWDAYQASYFDGFIDESGGADYSLPGPPGEGVAETYIPVYEFAEAVSCDFTGSTSTFTSQYCGSQTESMPFGTTLSSSACTTMISAGSSSCSVGTPTGGVDLDYYDYDPPWVCTIINGVGASGYAYILGPPYGMSGGVPVTFNITFFGQNSITHSGTTTVQASSSCPH